jgi:cytidylate kinase
MIIVLEGFDQAGKGTQSKLLAKALKTRKLKCKIFSFPDYWKRNQTLSKWKKKISTTSNSLSSCCKPMGKIKRDRGCSFKRLYSNNEQILSIKSSLWYYKWA